MLKFPALSAALPLAPARPGLAAAGSARRPCRRHPGDERSARPRPAAAGAPAAASCATTPTRTASSTAPNGWRARRRASSSSTPTATASSPRTSCLPARAPRPPAHACADRPAGAAPVDLFPARSTPTRTARVSLAEFMRPGRAQLRALRHQQGRPHRRRRMPPGPAAHPRRRTLPTADEKGRRSRRPSSCGRGIRSFRRA